jgi:hypothetical protein
MLSVSQRNGVFQKLTYIDSAAKVQKAGVDDEHLKQIMTAAD